MTTFVADAVVIGAPMYNWGIPSTLKAWLDHICVLGTTMPIDGPTQPFAGKPVVVPDLLTRIGLQSLRVLPWQTIARASQSRHRGGR